MSETVLINPPQASVDGINLFELQDYNGYFEQKYTNTAEPWDYSQRGAELLRHRYSVKKIASFMKGKGSLLETGCSKGLMTKLLIPYCHTICATDISITALKACKQVCDNKAKQGNCKMEYYATTLPGLPFADESFDVVSICDGFHGWWFSEEKKQLALEDTYRVLKNSGFAIITDYLMTNQNPNLFEEYEASIRKGPLKIVEISYLFDRPWYKLESLLKKTGLEKPLSGVLSNLGIASFLNGIGGMIGKKASNHIIIIATKE